VQLTLNIDDVNDNAPAFTQDKYEAKLMENQEDFNPPLFIEAFDDDLNGTFIIINKFSIVLVWYFKNEFKRLIFRKLGTVNSEVYYSIVAGNTMKNFTIDAVTGRVRPTFPIDFEKLPGNTHNGVRAMTMVIRAQDRGMPKPLFSEVSLVVYVHDVNDHAPRFEKLHYATTIPEDLSGGSPVIQVCMNIQYQFRKIIRCTFF